MFLIIVHCFTAVILGKNTLQNLRVFIGFGNNHTKCNVLLYLRKMIFMKTTFIKNFKKSIH